MYLYIMSFFNFVDEKRLEFFDMAWGQVLTRTWRKEKKEAVAGELSEQVVKTLWRSIQSSSFSSDFSSKTKP